MLLLPLHVYAAATTAARRRLYICITVIFITAIITILVTVVDNTIFILIVPAGVQDRRRGGCIIFVIVIVYRVLLALRKGGRRWESHLRGEMQHGRVVRVDQRIVHVRWDQLSQQYFAKSPGVGRNQVRVLEGVHETGTERRVERRVQTLNAQRHRVVAQRARRRVWKPVGHDKRRYVVRVEERASHPNAISSEPRKW